MPVVFLCLFSTIKLNFSYIHFQPVVEDMLFQSEKMLCRIFYEYGRCQRGIACPHVHGKLCPNCALFAIFPDDPEGGNHQELCEGAKAAMCRRYSEPSISKTCIICHGKVVGQMNRFAIMQSCNHVFCAPCIRRWRTTTTHPKETTK